MAKLRPFEVREIRWFYDQHQKAIANDQKPPYTLPEIGKLYNLHYTNVYWIGKRFTYSKVSDTPDHPNEGAYPKQPTKDALRKRLKAIAKRQTKDEAS